MIRINEIMDKLSGYMSEAELALIQKAYIFSATAHAGQTRLSGEPYLSHPLEVANLLAEMRLDAASVCAGLLHDTVEDTKATTEEIDEMFGEEVADIVDGVTKISMITFESKEEAQAENIRKMIFAMAEDIRVVLVKLCDRLHNMRTLRFHGNPAKQRLIAQETMDIYAPLANRLGLHRVKTELEDLSFKYIKPEVFAQISEGVDKLYAKAEVYIDAVVDKLRELCAANEIKSRIFGRKKHLWSLWNKMQQQGLVLEDVHDLVAFRVIVRSLKDCYAALGLAHSVWKPVPGRFKDYISMPKANMYQSLHTTVIGPQGRRIEIQIRTEDMHRLAEEGVAAHWQYKDRGKGQFKAKDVDRFNWLRQIMDWQRELDDSREFMQTLRIDLFQDEVYVFTPRGEVKELPEGATAVDFAYLIHTQVGDHCSGGKINGRLAPLSTPLKNGDAVEIITDPHRHPSRDWLKFVKTAKARTRIKHWIRTEERTRSIALGKEMLEKQGRKDGVNIQKALKDGTLGKMAEEFSFTSADELFSAVGYGRITARKVTGRLSPKAPETRPEPDKAEVVEAAQKAKGENIRIQGVDDVLVRFAQCCNPLPGDPIVGYISRGRGVTIHTHDCPNLKNLEAERLLHVTWEGEENTPYPARIRILARNEKGVLGKISLLMAEEGVNIDAGNIRSHKDKTSELFFTIEVRDASHLYGVMERIRAYDAVIEVERISTTEEIDDEDLSDSIDG